MTAVSLRYTPMWIFVLSFFFFWETSKDLFFKVPFATNIISLSFCEPRASGSCMRAQPYLWWFCDSFIKTALFRSNWEYLGTPASLDLSFGNRYWFSCLWLLRPRISPLNSSSRSLLGSRGSGWGSNRSNILREWQSAVTSDRCWCEQRARLV